MNDGYNLGHYFVLIRNDESNYYSTSQNKFNKSKMRKIAMKIDANLHTQSQTYIADLIVLLSSIFSMIFGLYIMMMLHIRHRKR